MERAFTKMLLQNVSRFIQCKWGEGTLRGENWGKTLLDVGFVCCRRAQTLVLKAHTLFGACTMNPKLEMKALSSCNLMFSSISPPHPPLKPTVGAMLYQFLKITHFINSILKSLATLAMWLALRGEIYSRIALSVALNRIFFSANKNGTVKQNSQSDFKAFLN